MIEDPPNGHSLGVALEPEGKRLSRAEFQGLGDMPPELEWFARPGQPPHPARLPPRRPGVHRLCRRHEARGDAASHPRPPESPGFKDLERRGLAKSSIRRKLGTVASLFDHLREVNAVSHNPVRGVTRLKVDQN